MWAQPSLYQTTIFIAVYFWPGNIISMHENTFNSANVRALQSVVSSVSCVDF